MFTANFKISIGNDATKHVHNFKAANPVKVILPFNIFLFAFKRSLYISSQNSSVITKNQVFQLNCEPC